MARSRNTENIQVKSEKSFDIDSIKIIMRKPMEGDIHPLDKEMIRGIITSIPSKYVYNLKKIELLPRKSKPGKPWGQYRFSEHKIILYSHPLEMEDASGYALNMAFSSNRSLSMLAELRDDGDKTYSVWTREMLMFFYFEILCHEIGHHYSEISKNKKKMPHFKFQEIIAELNKQKIMKESNPISKFMSDKSEKSLFIKKIEEFAKNEFLQTIDNQ